ncbi:hypothetical protein [Kibdelosporangium philippinense]|uniref:hypothetical protein n=1 Tax=Kibdelosporangium philippinense TaxID=211113 RepID=UPI00360FBB6B
MTHQFLGGLPVYLALSTVAYVSIRAIVAKCTSPRNREMVDEAMQALTGGARVDLYTGPPEAMPRDEFLKRANGKDGLLTMLSERVDAELLDAAGPQLKIVANHAVGYDNIDVAECTRRGVLVANTPDVLTEATADLAWALILACVRRIAEGDRFLRAEKPWIWGRE